MSAPPRRPLLIGLFVVVLLFHLSVLWQDFAILAKNGFLYDDSFYAFKIAQNIAAGHGATFDGVHPTNGFQPLYVFMLVPIFWLFGSELIAPIYLALSLCAVFTAVTAGLLFKIVERYLSIGSAIFVSLLWGLSPVVTRQTANGLETSLALMFFALAVFLYLSRIRSTMNPRSRDFVALGVVLGLAALARIDQMFLALAMFLDYLLILRKRGDVRTLTNQVFRAVTAALVVYSPWLVFSYFTMGRIVQDSGSATRYLSIAYAPFFELGSREMVTHGVTASFIWSHVEHAFSVLKVTPPLHVIFRGLEKFGLAVGAPDAIALCANVIGMAMLAGLLYFVLRRRPDGKGVNELRFLLVFVVAMVASYSLYVFGVFFFIRYLYPLYFIACLYVAFVLEAGLQRLARTTPRLRTAVASGLVIYLASFSYMAYNTAYRAPVEYHFYDVATWVDNNVLPQEKVGVFQGGAVGYLSHRRVVNLDGKVNRDALRALRDNNLVAYLRSEGIDVVLDNRQVISLFLGRPETQSQLTFDRIMFRGAGSVPGWTAYRVHPAIGTSGGGSVYAEPKSPSGTP